jgi:hypothetical protein
MIRTFLAMLLISLLLMVPDVNASVQMLPNGAKIFNTGIDDSGGVLQAGEIDPHYQLILNPANNLTYPFVVPDTSYLSPNTSDSQWIGPVGAFVDAPDAPDTYSVRTTFDLTGIELAGFSLDGFWISDNTGIDILVNGNSTGQTNSGAHLGAPVDGPGNAFTLSQFLVPGINEVDFVWQNIPHIFSNPTHVRVQFESFTSGGAVPELTSLLTWSTILGLCSLMSLCRRRKPR